MHDEYQLIAASQSGDLRSFETLIRAYQDRTVRHLYLLIGNYEDAQDVAQETFIRAFRSIRGFRSQSGFSTWLHRIAVNTAINWVRDNKRHRTTSEQMVLEHSEDKMRPDELLISRERARDIRNALLSLPIHYRETLILRHYEDLSYQEIADLQNIPVGTVRSRLAKGRHLLLQALKTTNGSIHTERILSDGLQNG